MAENVGAISYLVEIDTKNFTAQLKSVDGAVQSVAKSSSNHFSSFASNASSAFDGVASSIASLAKVAGATLIGGAFGGKVFVNAASQLQSLRASFESLTGSVEETNSVMGTLYKYGLQTAFKNESIQQTAKMFLANGVAVKDLMGWMQQLGDVAGATGADLTMLALPITQAIGKGKLQTQDWYQIINQGAGGLQKYIVAALGAGHSTKTFQDDLANGAVTADVLRKALAMASAEGGMAFRGSIKQAETFNGRMSNLIEGITNVGLAVLGVDAATGQVKAGGVFDELSKSVQQATEWFSENKQQIIGVANVIIDNAVPAIAGIAAAFTVAKVAAIGFNIAAGIAAGTISLPFILVAAAIAAVVAVITFLQLKFDIFGQAISFIKTIASDTFNNVKKWIDDVSVSVKGIYDKISVDLTNAFNTIKKIAEDTLSNIKKWLDDNKQAIINWSIVIGTIVGPAIVRMGAIAVANFAIIAANAVRTAAILLVQAVIGFGQWIAQSAVAGAKAVAQFAVMSARAVVTGAIMAVQGTIAFATWIAGSAVMIAKVVAGFALMAAQALISALSIGASWLLALGPIGAIIAVVVGVVALIIANWQTISIVVTNVFTYVGNFVNAVMENIKNFIAGAISWIGSNWQLILAILTGPIGIAVYVISSNMERIKSFFAGAVDFVKGVWGGIGNWFSGLGGQMVGAGKNMIDGLVKGISGAKDAVVNKVKEIASGALDAIKKFFGIHSPSKVMAQMGTYMMQGWSIGMDKSSSMAISSAQRASSGVLGTFDNLTSPTLGIDGTGSLSGSVGSRTANITNNYVVNNQADAEIISRKQAYAMGAV